MVFSRPCMKCHFHSPEWRKSLTRMASALKITFSTLCCVIETLNIPNKIKRYSVFVSKLVFYFNFYTDRC